MEASPIGTRKFPATTNLPSNANVRSLLGSGAGQFAKRAPMPQRLALQSLRLAQAGEIEMRVGEIGCLRKCRAVLVDRVLRSLEKEKFVGTVTPFDVSCGT